MSDWISDDIEKIERALNIRLDELPRPVELKEENSSSSSSLPARQHSRQDEDLSSLLQLSRTLNHSLQRSLFQLSEHCRSLENSVEEKGEPMDSFPKQIFDFSRAESISVDLLRSSVDPSIQSLRRQMQKDEKSRLCSTDMVEKIIRLVADQLRQWTSSSSSSSSTDLPDEKLIEEEFDEEKINWSSIVDQLNSSVTEKMIKHLWKELCQPKIHSSEASWTKEDDELLRHLVDLHGSAAPQWSFIASHFTNRSAYLCAQRYFSVSHQQLDQMKFSAEQLDQLRRLALRRAEKHYMPLNRIAFEFGFSLSRIRREWRNVDPSVRRGQWNDEEDRLLLASVAKQSTGRQINWNFVSLDVSGRSSTKCFHRFIHLNRQVHSNQFEPNEDQRLVEEHRRRNGRWSEIQQSFPGRSCYTLQNRWRKLMRHRQLNEFVSQLDDRTKIFLNKCFPAETTADETNLFSPPRLQLTLSQLKSLTSTPLFVDFVASLADGDEEKLFSIGIRQFLNFLKSVRRSEEIRGYFSSSTAKAKSKRRKAETKKKRTTAGASGERRDVPLAAGMGQSDRSTPSTVFVDDVDVEEN